LGSITVITSYTATIAFIQRERLPPALEALKTLSSMNSGRLMIPFKVYIMDLSKDLIF